MIGITGGSGYIGTWLTKKIFNEGLAVRVIDIELPKIPITSDTRLRFACGDILNEEAISDVIKGCDVVYHLAAVVSKLRGFEDRRKCIETNVLGTLNVLEACRKHDVKRLVYVGTSEIAGKTTYGISKCAGESLCLEYHLMYGLNVVMPRLYMIYGINDYRPMKYQNVIVKFIHAFLNDKSPMVYRGCERSFLYITDCVEALYRLKDEGKAGEIYDVCNHKSDSVSMVELAWKIMSLCEKYENIMVFDPPPNDTKVKLPDGTKTYEMLDWVPRVSLDDGLLRVIDWMKEKA